MELEAALKLIAEQQAQIEQDRAYILRLEADIKAHRRYSEWVDEQNRKPQQLPVSGIKNLDGWEVVEFGQGRVIRKC